MLDSPGGASGKESTCQCRRYKRQVPSPGEGNGNPLQYSCMENSVDRGSWWASVHGVPKSPTQLSKAAHVFLAHHGLGFYTIHFSVRRLYIGHTWATFGSLQGVQHLEDLGTDSSGSSCAREICRVGRRGMDGLLRAAQKGNSPAPSAGSSTSYSSEWQGPASGKTFSLCVQKALSSSESQRQLLESPVLHFCIRGRHRA